MRFVLGIDIGGTNLVTGAVAEDGSAIRGVAVAPTAAEGGPDDVIRRIVQQARGVMSATRREIPSAEFIGVGIGSPGPLDIRSGTVLFTPNLGWENLPLRQRISAGLELPAALDNDANCALLGEAWVGAARGARQAVALTLGTGIGGGILIDGQIYHGTSDGAGEVGHTIIEADGRRCRCGNYGCLEAYASGPAIAARAIEALESGAASNLAEYVAGDLSRLTAQTVYQAASDGDPLARDVAEQTAGALGAAVASLINLLNPEVVVVCGGVAGAGERLFEPLRREVARRAFRTSVAACRIVAGELPGTAGVYGAARAFLDQCPQAVAESNA